MARIVDIAEIDATDGLPPSAQKKVNINFRKLVSLVSSLSETPPETATSGIVDNIVSRVVLVVLDISWPVGSTVVAMERGKHPQVGTWELVRDLSGRYFRITDADSAGTGGSDQVTLTTGNLPPHTHGRASLTGHASVTANVVNNAGHEHDLYDGSGIVSVTASGRQDKAYVSSNVASGWTGRHDTISVDASHEHASVGSSDPISIQPRYAEFYVYRRVS